MGADADAVVEVKWSHDGLWVPLATFHFYDRNYEVFGEVNGVRRAFRIGPGGSGDVTRLIDEPLIAEPRGLPPDRSSHTAELAEDSFRPTWLSIEEVERVDRQLRRLHGEAAGGISWPAIVACMRSTPRPTRLVFWTDQS